MKLKITNKFTSLLAGKHPQPDAATQNKTNPLQAEGFERCVMCGNVTNVPVSMPIDFRDNYEAGCGQLCSECALKQHNFTPNTSL